MTIAPRFTAPRGQSLTETMVAIGVIMSAVVAVASLATLTVRGQRVTEEVVIATNLAREGLELVRAFRDTGFILGLRATGCPANCTTLPDKLPDHEAIPQLVNVRAPFTVNAVLNYNGSDNNDFGSLGNEICLGHAPHVYYYQQFNGSQRCTEVGGTLTRFRRRVVLDYICLDPATNGECVETDAKQICGTGRGSCDARFGQFIGHRVQSLVLITGRQGPDREIKAEEYLYAWK